MTEAAHRERHYEKDRAYHAAIGAEYHEVVVDPRRFPNDLLFAPIARVLPRGGRMLDLGCGTGHMMLRFGGPFDKIVGVDHSETMLASARHQLDAVRMSRVKLVESDLFGFLDDNRSHYDLVTCVGCLHHLLPEEIAPLVAGAAKALAPGGVLVLAEPVELGEEPPEAVTRWNQGAAALGLGYSKHAEEPDEAPIDEALINGALERARLRRVAESRGCELLPRHLPPTLLDRLAIRWLHWRHGARGNVLALAARRRSD